MFGGKGGLMTQIWNAFPPGVAPPGVEGAGGFGWLFNVRDGLGER